ncbi:hypothetical protein JN531_004010 [Flagellatimonas centrodinii]|uniref:hypothetical protein n=1 Tax=Flagellatimonas centrodinii TaxID=2806210 RepID=UPI001FF8D4C3|nr:hypothetical protein [Flagellatimonas centrodinii]ULQ47452.1 hypothetical protein JN531_004010 [Flagellatimonas centrodinii]
MSRKIRNLISRKEAFLFGLLSGVLVLLLLMAWLDFIDADLEFFANLGTLLALFVSTFTYVASNIDMRHQRKIEAANRLRRPFMKLKSHNNVFIAQVRVRVFNVGNDLREIPDYLMSILKVNHDHAAALEQAGDAALDSGWVHAGLLDQMLGCLSNIRNEIDMMEILGTATFKNVQTSIKDDFERFIKCATEFRDHCKEMFPEQPSFVR